MLTIGVDFSKRTSVYSVWDATGHRLQRCKLDNEPQVMRQFFQALPAEPIQLAMEATRNWGLYYETVRGSVDHFYLAHPVKMKAITQSETKNDQHDADLIARLTQSGFLPTAHISSLGTRQLRSLRRFRTFCVHERTAVRNQVQTLIDRNVWPAQRPTSFKNPCSRRGLAWLTTVSLPERERFILTQCLATYAHVTHQITAMEREVERQAVDLPGIAYLRTVPGFHKSRVHLYTVLLEIDDIQRFHKARNLAHYAGLIPREHSSGDTHRTGRLVKQANKHLRTALLESVFGAMLADRSLRAYYQSVKDRRGSGPAIIATTRQLSYAVYHVLKDQTAYRAQSFPPATASGPLAEE